MLESLFQFLFEYRLTVFRQGDFQFAPPAGAPVAAAIVIAAVAMAFVSYRILRSRVRGRERGERVGERQAAHRGRPDRGDRKSTRLNSSHNGQSRMPSSA